MNDDGPDNRGHICLLIHHYGPSGHTGGFRWHSITSGLAARGWTFDVVTSTPHDQALPPVGVRVHTVDDDWVGSRLRRWASSQAARLRSTDVGGGSPTAAPSTRPSVPAADEPWTGQRRPLGELPLGEQLRRDLTDATTLLTEAVWAQRVGRLAAGLDRRPQVVITTSPAELLHPVGTRVARKVDARHITDFRDLWVIGRPDFAMRSRPWRYLGRLFERRSLRGAAVAVDIASLATERRQLARIVPCAFIPSGYVAVDEPTAPDRETFRIVYSGWWYADMDPRPLLDGCRQLVDARPQALEHLSIELLGSSTHVAGRSFHELAASVGLGDHLDITARLPRDDATRREALAAVLVCYGFTDGLHTPSKLYGYARLRGRLLLIGAADDATAREAALIGVRACEDADSVSQVLVEAYDRWCASGPWPVTDRAGVLSEERSVQRYDGLLGALVAGENMAIAAPRNGPTLPSAAVSLGDRAPRPHVGADSIE